MMQKIPGWLLFFILLLPALAYAQFTPVFTLILGIDHSDLSQQQNVSLIEPLQNTYHSSHDMDSTLLQGIFLGTNVLAFTKWPTQIGLGYYQNSGLITKGTIYQFTDPTLADIGYQYQIQSQRLLIETNVFTSLFTTPKLFFSVGAGIAKNKSTQYQEITLNSSGVPMAQAFANHNTTSFTYALGAGLDIPLFKHWHLQWRYLFSDLGKSSLGTTPLQDANQRLHYSNLYSQQILLQLSYIG